MDINLVKKMPLMGSIWSKEVKFGENDPNWFIMGGQNDAIVQNLVNVVKIFNSKIISVRFININLVQNVINRVNLVQIGHFW